MGLTNLHVIAFFFNLGNLVLHQAQDLAYDMVEDGL